MNKNKETARTLPTSFREIFLKKWAPAIIVATIGAVAVPWLQTTFASRTELAKRRLQLWESIGENFTGYVKYRGRLNDAALEKSLDETFSNRKEEYRRKRDEYSNALQRDLVLAKFYFSEKVRSAINKFLDWHEKYRDTPVDKLPPDKEYLDYQQIIMTLIKDEL